MTTTINYTAAQQARLADIERQMQQLRGEGCPDHLLRAYEGAPALARRAWLDMKKAPKDPEAVHRRVLNERFNAQHAEQMREHKERIAAEREAERLANEAVDLDRLERTTRDRLETLRAKRIQLAGSALVDSRAAEEMRGLDAEARRCQETLEWVPLARAAVEAEAA